MFSRIQVGYRKEIRTPTEPTEPTEPLPNRNRTVTEPKQKRNCPLVPIRLPTAHWSPSPLVPLLPIPTVPTPHRSRTIPRKTEFPTDATGHWPLPTANSPLLGEKPCIVQFSPFLIRFCFVSRSFGRRFGRRVVRIVLL